MNISKNKKINFRMVNSKNDIRTWTNVLLEYERLFYYIVSGPVNDKILSFLCELYRNMLDIPITMKLGKDTIYVERTKISGLPLTLKYSEVIMNMKFKCIYDICMDDVCLDKYFQKDAYLYCMYSIECFGKAKLI